MAFEIEKNIPPPQRGARTKYPWAEMKIGDSFFVPGIKSGSSFSSMASRFGLKIVTKLEDGGVRIWRTA